METRRKRHWNDLELKYHAILIAGSCTEPQSEEMVFCCAMSVTLSECRSSVLQLVKSVVASCDVRIHWSSISESRGTNLALKFFGIAAAAAVFRL